MTRPIDVPYAINVTGTNLTIASTDTTVRADVSYPIGDVVLAAADTDSTHVTIRAHEDDATTVNWQKVTNLVPVSRADFISQVQALIDTELSNPTYTTVTTTGAVSAGSYGIRNFVGLMPGAMGTLSTSYKIINWGYGQDVDNPSTGQRNPSDTEDFILTHVNIVIDDDVATQTDIEVRVQKNGVTQIDEIGGPVTNVGGGLITLSTPVTYAPGDYLTVYLHQGPSGTFGSECRVQPFGYFAR